MRQVVRLMRLSVYTYQVRLINFRCLYETTRKVEPLFRLYLPNSPSHLALFARNNSKVEAIVLVYLPSPLKQLALVARDNS